MILQGSAHFAVPRLGRALLHFNWPIVTIVLTALTVSISLAAPEPSAHFDLLVLDRTQTRPWTWLTTHFLHTNYNHLVWNIAALVCLGWIGEIQGRLRFFLSVCVGMFAVDLWFALFADDLRFYCGLSGALNAVLLTTLYAGRASTPKAWLFLFAAAVAIKLIWELNTGVALFTHTRWPSAVSAHIAGYGAGALLVALFAWRDRPFSI